uniref:Uncharacterized protein n=1 Tax=Rhizophora mucronata TaxID=61149 RepID=A0A2P2N150_RHIMU
MGTLWGGIYEMVLQSHGKHFFSEWSCPLQYGRDGLQRSVGGYDSWD